MKFTFACDMIRDKKRRSELNRHSPNGGLRRNIGVKGMNTNTKKLKVGHVLGIIFWVISGLFVILCVFTNLIRAGVLAVLFALTGLTAWGMSGMKNGKMKALFCVSVTITVFYLFLSLCFPPFGMSTHSKWKYPVMKMVASCYRNTREPEWFPDFTSDVEDEFSFEYLPSVLQGSGYYDVRFVTRPETARQYVQDLTVSAVETLPLQDYLERNPYSMHHSDESFWSGNIQGTMVYILYTNNNINHPHEDILVVNVNTGRVQLFSE